MSEDLMLVDGRLVVLALGSEGRIMMSEAIDVARSSRPADGGKRLSLVSWFVRSHSASCANGLVGFEELGRDAIRFELTICSASITDAAVTTVLLLAAGAGSEESDLNKGCM